MRKTVLTILGTALLAASTTQFAAAAERHHSKPDRMTTQEQFRNTNAYYAAPAFRDESSAWRVQEEAQRFQDVEAGAPAGR